MTCGTGSQVFWLVKRGYQVVGSDISPGMLKLAKQKARQEKLELEFHQGDMRNVSVGIFDSVITIFNAVVILLKPILKRRCAMYITVCIMKEFIYLIF